MRQTSKRILGVVLALVMVFGCFPISAFAEQMSFTPPTQAMEIDDNLITMAAHSQGWITPEVLGITNVTGRSDEVYDAYTNGFSEAYSKSNGKVAMGVFGSDINDAPNPYLYNYYYNCFADESARTPFGTYTLSKAIGNRVAPWNAAPDVAYTDDNGNSICASLWLRPDILLGIGPVSGDTTGYTDSIAELPENVDADETNNYNPYQVNYTYDHVYDFLTSMYELSDICKDITAATGKHTRYDVDAYTITSNIEKYVKGLQAYVIGKINQNNLDLATVAVIDISATATLRSQGIVADNEYVINTVDNCTITTSTYSRVAEFIADIATNIADVVTPKVIPNVTLTSNNRTKTTDCLVVTADEIAANATMILTGSVQGTASAGTGLNPSSIKNDVIQKCEDDTLATKADNIEVMEVAFQCVGSIGANSVENLLGMAYYTAYLYPQYLNQFEVVTYWYQNFYHISDNTALKAAIQANMKDSTVLPAYKDKYTCDVTNYDPAKIEKLIVAGMNYYDTHKDEFKDCYLYKNGKTGAMTGWDIDWENGIGAGARGPETLATPTVTLSRVSGTTSSGTKYVGKAKLTWAAIEGADKYEVYRATSKDGSYSKLGTTTGLSYTNSGAPSGTTYYYKVKAICSDGTYDNSAFSEAKGFTTSCDAPTIKLTRVNGKAKITWSKITGASKYEVYRATSKTGTYKKLGTTTNLSYTNSGAPSGTTYYYKVKAISSASTYANSAFSSIKSFTTSCEAPAVSIALSSNKPKVSWKKITGASKYEVYRATSKSGSYSKIATTTSLSYTDKKATKGKTYYYKVKAINGASSYANSAYSAIKSIKSK